MSGTPSRRPCVCPTDADVDPDTIPGVYRGGESGEPKGDACHGKKRAASGGQEGKPSKKGKMPSSVGLNRASDVDVELDDEDKPLARP